MQGRKLPSSPTVCLEKRGEKHGGYTEENSQKEKEKRSNERRIKEELK